ncbi:helix-turn-helix transcriptional regulator [Serratia fonticola]
MKEQGQVMKKTHIKIFIQDTNQYFAQGLAALLQSFYLSRQATVTFLSKKNYYLADLVIVSSDTPSFIWAYRARQFNTRQLLFLIQDSSRYRTAPSDLHEAGVIKRGDNTNSVLQLIDLALIEQADCVTNLAQFCMPVLTPREIQVLSAIALGFQSVRIAKKLGLHVKTISAHKCAAMRKLGFSRNQELYNWLHIQSELAQSPINTQNSAPITVPMKPSGKELQ